MRARRAVLSLPIVSIVLAMVSATGSTTPCRAELFSFGAADLVTWYGGGEYPDYRQTTFDFQQSFVAVDRAWLHVEATSTWPHVANWFGCGADLNDVGGPGYFDGWVQPWQTLNVDLALTPGPGVLDGTGSVGLYLAIFDPSDVAALVTEAQLWFDATPVPEPASLALLGLGALALRRRRR